MATEALTDLFFRPPDLAFAAAIRAGRLSEDPDAAGYAGRFMYMGTQRASFRPVRRQKDLFKSVVTRRYLPELDEPGYADVLDEERAAMAPRGWNFVEG